MSVALVGHALCSVRDVKMRLDSDMGSQYDDLFAGMINALSDRAQEIAGCDFEKMERTAYFDAGVLGGVGGPLGSFLLPVWPVDEDAAFSLWDDPQRAFGSSTLLTLGTDYVVDYKFGRVTRISPSGVNIGFPSSPDPLRPLLPELGAVAFNGGLQSLKATWTAGVVVPRASAPPAPSLSLDGVGVLAGIYKYKRTIVTDATSAETIASVSAAITTATQKTQLSFANPGVGFTSRIYRTKAGEARFFYLGSLAGASGGGTQTFGDNNADGMLDLEREAPEAGPLTVKSDLREATAQQIAHWSAIKNDPGQITVSSTGQGSIVYAKSQKDLLPNVLSTYESYARE